MNWTIIKIEDLESALNKPQLDVLKSARYQSATRSVAEDIISNVVAEMRMEIAAGEINHLDANHAKIPRELKECALRLAVERLILRLPNMEPSQLQMKHADIARETLSRVSQGLLPISQPDNPVGTGRAKKSAEVVNKRKRSATSESMKGL